MDLWHRARAEEKLLAGILVLALVLGILPVAEWYRFIDNGGVGSVFHNGSVVSDQGGLGFVYAHSLWSSRPITAAVITVGASGILAAHVSVVFRASWDTFAVSRVVTGFSALVALAMIAAASVGLSQLTNSCWTTEPDNNLCVSARTEVGWAAPTAVALSVLLLVLLRALYTCADTPSAPLDAGGAPAAHAAVGAAPSADTAEVRRDADGDTLKRCPECAEWVKAAARVCRYCNHTFARSR